MRTRGRMEIEKKDFELAIDKMKEEINTQGINIKEILCKPMNIGPVGERNSLNFVGHYVIEFLFLGEKDNEESIYSCSCHANGMISEYVMDRPGAYPNPKAKLWEGIKYIEIDKVTGPISEIIYGYYGRFIYEYEFIYQPLNNDSEIYYLKMGHRQNAIYPSRSVIEHSKITSLVNQNDYLHVILEDNPAMICIPHTNPLYEEAPNTEDILNKVKNKSMKLNLSIHE